MNSRQNERKWTKAISRWKASGKSQKGFCQDEGISYWTFRDWKSKLGKGKAASVKPEPFVEISNQFLKAPAADATVRITLPCGIIIETWMEAGIERIAALLQAGRSL